MSACVCFISVKLCWKLTSSATVASTSNLLYLRYRRTCDATQLCDGGIGCGEHMVELEPFRGLWGGGEIQNYF